MAPESSSLSSKGRQTRLAIEQAARKLFAERGFHGTTLADITSAAGKSTAVFYRYFDDKEDLLAALAESFLHDIVAPSATVALPESPDDGEYFTTVVTGYWNMFKQNIGIMIAVAQLAAAKQRFANVQNEFRRFGMDIVAASVRHAQHQGYGTDLDAEHIAAAIALLFENFTVVMVGTPAPEPAMSDADAIRTLSTIWKKTLYGR